MGLVGDILNGLFNQVDQTVQNAISSEEDAAKGIIIEAGQELEVIIANAKDAYSKCLNETIVKVDETVRKTILQLQSVVDSFVEKETDLLNQIMLQAQQVANSLPFSNKMPQLTTINPHFLNPTSDTTLTFGGNFVYAGDPRYQPKLTLNNKEYRGTNITTQALSFTIPAADIAPLYAAHNYAFIPTSLTVPWKDSGYIFSSTVKDVYTIGVALLPAMPTQSLIVEYTSTTTQRVSQVKTSQTFSENGNRYYPIHWKTINEFIYPDNGWEVDITQTPSVNFTIEHGGPDNAKYSVVEPLSPSQIVVAVTLYCGSGSDMGICHFNVSFAQFQDQTTTNTRTQTIDNFKWGDQLALQPNSGETITKITAVTYDGKTLEFAGADFSHYLKVSISGDTWTIQADLPDC